MSKKDSARTEKKPPREDKEDVPARLRSLRVIRSRSAQTFFRALPILLALLVLADWLLGGGAFSRDTFRMTGVLTVAAMLLAVQVLFDHLPNVLEIIWRRNLIATTGKDMLSYLERLEVVINGRGAWALALLLALGSLFATYPFRYWMVARRFPFDPPTTLAYYFGGQVGVIAPVLGFIVGLLAWRVGVIAYFIGKLGEMFPIRVQVNHYDRCGGLKPLGDLAFNIAIIVLIPSIFLGVWGFITAIFDNPELQLYITLWGGLFRQLLVLLGVLSVFLFLQPVYRIHLRMEEYKRTIQSELDELSLKIESMSYELRNRAGELTPQEGGEKLNAIEFMRNVYESNSQIPTWPFDWKILLRFTSAQFIPLLSLIGTSGSLVEALKILFAVGK
jgi:hypothetical protein